MKNSGYDQFFKAAKKQRLEQSTKPGNGEVKAAAKKPARKKAKVKKAKSSWAGLSFSVVVLAAALGGLLYIEEFESATDLIEIGFLGQAKAAEEKSKAKDEQKEKTAAEAADKVTAATPEKSSADSEELSYLSKLRERKIELDQKEQALADMEKELQDQKRMLDGKIKELKKVRDEIASVLKERITFDDERISKLVDFYSDMKPQQAAQVFEDIDEDLAVEVLGRMKKKNAANILNLLKPDKAQALSEKFAGFQQASK